MNRLARSARWSRLLKTSPAALLVVACGTTPTPGTTPGTAGAREAAAAWYQALLDDTGTACDLMTGNLRTKVMAAAQATTCDDAIRTYRATLAQPAKQAIKRKDFTLTLKDTDYATVQLNTATTADTFAVTWHNARCPLDDIVR